MSTFRLWQVCCEIRNTFNEIESAKTIQAASRAAAHRLANSWFHGAFIAQDEIKKSVNEYDGHIESWIYEVQK